MSTQTIHDLKFNRKNSPPTSIQHKIKSITEEEEKNHYLSYNSKMSVEGSKFVKMVDIPSEASRDLLEQTYKKIKKDKKLPLKINDSDLISITPASSPYQKKSNKYRLNRSITSDSSHPYFKDKLKLYAKLTENRIKNKPVVNNPTLLLNYKNFYSSSFSMQPGFSFGHLPRVFPPKFEVPGPGAYNVQLMERYMRHIPGPIYKESKVVTPQSPSPVLQKKDLQNPKPKVSNNKSNLKHESPTAFSKGRNIEFKNDTNKTYNKDSNFPKFIFKPSNQNYSNLNKQPKISKNSEYLLKTQVNTFDKNQNIRNNFKNKKNTSNENDDLSYPYMTKCVGIDYLPHETD